MILSLDVKERKASKIRVKICIKEVLQLKKTHVSFKFPPESFSILKVMSVGKGI